MGLEKGKFDRQVGMKCSVCGHDQFRFDEHDEEMTIECPDCGVKFHRDELVQENGPRVAIEIDELKKDALRMVKIDLNKMIREINKKMRR